MIKAVHENSIECYNQLDLDKRREVVLSVYGLYHPEPITDRQVKEYLRFEDMNQVRPRVSELIDLRLLAECGKVADHISGRSVRICRLTTPQEREDKQIRLF